MLSEEKIVGSWQLAVGSWQGREDRWQSAVGSWQERKRSAEV